MTLTLLISCGKSPFPTVNTSGSGTGTGTGTTTTTTTTSTLATVTVSTAYDTAPTTFTTHKECTVPSDTATGGTVSCTATIPEGMLHFSSLKIALKVDSSTSCSIVTFQPYYYKASNSLTWLPNWGDGTTTLDCTLPASSISVDCYNGPATKIVPSFPVFTFLYLTPDSTSGIDTSWTIASANASKRTSGNRWTNNTLAVRTASLTSVLGDGYVANSMNDYSFSCRDKWYEPLYTLNLTIQDENTGGAACDPNDSTCNQWTNWNSTQASDPQ